MFFSHFDDRDDPWAMCNAGLCPHPTAAPEVWWHHDGHTGLPSPRKHLLWKWWVLNKTSSSCNTYSQKLKSYFMNFTRLWLLEILFTAYQYKYIFLILFNWKIKALVLKISQWTSLSTVKFEMKLKKVDTSKG